MKFQYSNLASLEVFRIRGMINRFIIILMLENSINTFIEFWQIGYYGCCNIEIIILYRKTFIVNKS